MPLDTENYSYDEATIELMKKIDAPDEYSKEEQADEPLEAKPVPVASERRRKKKGSK